MWGNKGIREADVNHAAANSLPRPFPPLPFLSPPSPPIHHHFTLISPPKRTSEAAIPTHTVPFTPFTSYTPLFIPIHPHFAPPNAPLKQDSLCMVGILMTKAKRSSMNVFSDRYIRNFHGRWATLFSL